MILGKSVLCKACIGNRVFRWVAADVLFHSIIWVQSPNKYNNNDTGAMTTNLTTALSFIGLIERNGSGDISIFQTPLLMRAYVCVSLCIHK